MLSERGMREVQWAHSLLSLSPFLVTGVWTDGVVGLPEGKKMCACGGGVSSSLRLRISCRRRLLVTRGLLLLLLAFRLNDVCGGPPFVALVEEKAASRACTSVYDASLSLIYSHCRSLILSFFFFFASIGSHPNAFLFCREKLQAVVWSASSKRETHLFFFFFSMFFLSIVCA